MRLPLSSRQPCARSVGQSSLQSPNRPASCPTGVPRCFEADIAIAVPKGAPSLPVEIRYSLVNPVLKIDSDTFDNRTINGDGTVTITAQDGTTLWEGWPDTIVGLRP